MTKNIRKTGIKAPLISRTEKQKEKLTGAEKESWLLWFLAVICLAVVLAVSGTGANKEKSLEHIFTGEKPVEINCLGDSFTEGVFYSGVSYPAAMQETLEKYPDMKVVVRNYGTAASVLDNTSYKQMTESADIVMILYGLNNYLSGRDAKGTLEANIEGIKNSRSLVYLVTYPVCPDGPFVQKVKDTNSYIQSVSQAKEVFLFDAAAYFEELVEHGTYAAQDLYSSDCLHLSAAGYQVLGAFLADGLMAQAGRN